MTITPTLAFDVCWEVYQAVKVDQDVVPLLRVDQRSDGLWRPQHGARGNEFAADFALAGKAALEDSAVASRLVLFRVYYLGLAPYSEARRFLGIGDRSFEQWSCEIKEKVGKELMCRELFPPRAYFGETTRPATKRPGMRVA